MNPKSENPFEDSELTTILVVRNIEASRSFYIDQLGAELFREYGGSSLVTAGEPTADKPEIFFAPSADSNQVSQSFTIRVKDCQESYNILKNRGVIFITPPYDWGAEIRCFFKDPDGHLFEISEFRG